MFIRVLGEEQELTNREVLKGFYSAFKAADQYLRFVLLTGVTKFSQVSVFSGFNQPADISMDRRYEALCGITEEELYRYFDAPIGELAEVYGMDKADMKEFLKRQYDGYHFHPQGEGLYNPFSVLNAFFKKEFGNYWFQTGTPTFLVKYLFNLSEKTL